MSWAAARTVGCTVLNADQMGKLGDAATQKDGSIDELQAAAPTQPHHQHRHHVHGSPPFSRTSAQTLYLGGRGCAARIPFG